MSANYRNSDREVDLKIQTSIYTCGGCCGNYYNQVKVEGGMWAFKKNFWGNWVDYGTTYNYEQLEFQITAPQVVGYSVGPNGQLVSEFNYQPYTLSSLSGASSGGDWGELVHRYVVRRPSGPELPDQLPVLRQGKGAGQEQGDGRERRERLGPTGSTIERATAIVTDILALADVARRPRDARWLKIAPPAYPQQNWARQGRALDCLAGSRENSVHVSSLWSRSKPRSGPSQSGLSRTAPTRIFGAENLGRLGRREIARCSGISVAPSSFPQCPQR